MEESLTVLKVLATKTSIQTINDWMNLSLAYSIERFNLTIEDFNAITSRERCGEVEAGGQSVCGCLINFETYVARPPKHHVTDLPSKASST